MTTIQKKLKKHLMVEVKTFNNKNFFHYLFYLKNILLIIFK